MVAGLGERDPMERCVALTIAGAGESVGFTVPVSRVLILGRAVMSVPEEDLCHGKTAVDSC